MLAINSHKIYHQNKDLIKTIKNQKKVNNNLKEENSKKLQNNNDLVEQIKKYQDQIKVLQDKNDIQGKELEYLRSKQSLLMGNDKRVEFLKQEVDNLTKENNLLQSQIGQI